MPEFSSSDYEKFHSWVKSGVDSPISVEGEPENRIKTLILLAQSLPQMKIDDILVELTVANPSLEKIKAICLRLE